LSVDIRLPLGILFSMLGILLTGYGFVANAAIYERSLGINVNLDWGIVLLVFGILMILLGRHATKTARQDSQRPPAPNATKSSH
jgi:hypothetical protein